MRKGSSRRFVCVLLAILLAAICSSASVSAQTLSGNIVTSLVNDLSENNWGFQQYMAVDTGRHRLYQVGMDQYGANSYARLAVIDTLNNTLITEWLIDSIPADSFFPNYPQGIAVNTVTNKIYVTLSNGVGSGDWALAIIDGATGQNRMLVLPQQPEQTAIAVNPLNNMIYLSAQHWILAVNGSDDSISVINIPGARIGGMAINSKTNKLYLTSAYGESLNVVDLESNAVSSLSLPNNNGSAFGLTSALAVNEERNEVYFTGADQWSQFAVAILDGNTNTFTFAPFPDVPRAGNEGVIPLVNPATNRVYFGAGYFFVMNAVTREIAYLPTSVHTQGQLAVYDPSLNHAYSIATAQYDPMVALDLGSSSTPTGAGVAVQADLLSLTFDNVVTAGTTAATPIDPGTAGQIPGGFAISDSVAYEISTTAGFSGPVTIAFTVPGPISEADFNSLSILHNENGTLVDVTAIAPARVYATRTIYATTTSFSPFYLTRKGPHIKTLFDQTKAYKSGSTIPIKLRLLNASDQNTSSSSTALTTRNLKSITGNTLAPVTDSGNANPDYNFRYDPSLAGAGGGYIYNLSTKGLTPGQYALSFYVGSDRSFFYTVKFEVK